MNIIKKIKAKFKRSKKKLDKEYFFGDYKIILKGNHVLDKYQHSFPLYDRFLPLLCSSFDGLIIDIGANIGDTTIAIFSKNSKSFILGVEPDAVFYKECISNILLNGLTNRFLGVNKFVSTNEGNFCLEKSSTMSTGSISSKNKQSGKKNTISFSELMNLIPIEKTIKFDVLKIDTDGFDWDILNSFVQYVNDFRIKPRFVFFEMQTYSNNIGVFDENRRQIAEEYTASIKSLKHIGYNNFCLIDNFGTPIKITQSIEEIFQLNDYITRSQVHNLHSTIYYLDILAFSDNEFEFVKQVIKNLY
ncbi:MAG: FkbM family methyltransferase [Flavobacteriales bacterium]|jgi:FkbM family methyltransferase